MEVSKYESSNNRRGSSKSESGVSISESKLGSYLSYSSVSKQGEVSASKEEVVEKLEENESADKGENLKNTDPPKKKIYERECSKKLKAFLEHWTSQVFMTTITVYILFADDMKMCLTDVTADPAFSSVCIAIMLIFTVEFVISAFVIPDYFLGFYFWLDFVSIISMLLDIHWFYDSLMNLITGTTSYTEITSFSNSNSTNSTGVGTGGTTNIKSIATIAKLGRAAKVGSRAIRILRILRIIRLVRISKLYKASERLIEEKVNKEMKKLKTQGDGENKKNIANQNYNKRGEEIPAIAREEVPDNRQPAMGPGSPEGKENIPEDSDASTEAIPQESKVGNKLTDLTTRRVIILVLAMMIGIILFDPTFYYTQVTSMDFGITVFKDFSIDDPNFNLTFDIYVNEHLNISSPIIFAQVGYLSFGNYTESLYLRPSEQIISGDDCSSLIPNNSTYSVCMAIFNNKWGSTLSSILNMMKTIFICIVLTGGAVCFSKDTSDMVLQPIESMIQKIKEISKNPLEAMQNNEKEEFAKSLLEEEEKEKVNCFCVRTANPKSHSKKKEAPLETTILENTISKIGALLALGFGEAGSEIIAKNMQNNANGDVNPMLPGKKVMAIYGFCDIRNFTDTTEVLQEKVMIFVNEIAEIVHEITAEHCGSANKNIGDAFLLIWKFEEQFVRLEDGELTLVESKSVSQICDMALMSFIKILGKVHKSYKLDKYRKNKGLNDRIKNYAVKMGFGLHLGWSIEGAIGSTFKIDASYLSPHVNTASHLEEKTKEYGVQLVISGDFMKYVSKECLKSARIIDEHTGDDGRINTVYTIDIDTSALKIEEVDSDAEENKSLQIGKSEKKLEKFKKRMKRRMNYEDAINCVRNIWKDFEDLDEDFLIMRKKYTSEFYDYFNQGFEYYRSGDWMLAKDYLEKAQEVLGDKDGPSENLLRIMRQDYFIKPRQESEESKEKEHEEEEENKVNVEEKKQVEVEQTHETHPDGWTIKKK